MTKIHTIEDLRKASSKQIAEALGEVTVLKDLDKYLAWLNSPDGVATSGTFKLGNRKRGLGLHPSQWAHKGACPLKLYYDCTGEIEPDRRFDPHMQQIFDLGTLIHSMTQMHFLHMYGNQFEDEVWVHDDHDLHITGHTDGAFKFTRVRFALELKSIKEGGNFGFEKVQMVPMEDHVRQCMIYMHEMDCPFGLILYFCKNTSKKKEHAIAWSDEVWDQLVSEARPVIDAAYHNGPKPAGKTGHNCRDCEYSHGCPAWKEHKKNGAREKDTYFRR